MNSAAYNNEIEELLKEYRKRRADAGELQRRILAVSGTAVAVRQTVKVTVNAQGEITALEFPTGAYKRMAPAELTEAILATVREAKAKAVEALKELMDPELPNGLNFTELMQGKADLTAALPMDPSMPDAVREYVDSGRIAARDTGGNHV